MRVLEKTLLVWMLVLLGKGCHGFEENYSPIPWSTRLAGDKVPVVDGNDNTRKFVMFGDHVLMFSQRDEFVKFYDDRNASSPGWSVRTEFSKSDVQSFVNRSTEFDLVEPFIVLGESIAVDGNLAFAFVGLFTKRDNDQNVLTRYRPGAVVFKQDDESLDWVIHDLLLREERNIMEHAEDIFDDAGAVDAAHGSIFIGFLHDANEAFKNQSVAVFQDRQGDGSFKQTQILSLTDTGDTAENGAVHFGDHIRTDGATTVLVTKGKVFVYEKMESGDWVFVRTLTSPHEFDRFGSSVDIGKDIIVVGRDKPDDPDQHTDEKVAFVFKRTSTNRWVYTFSLSPPNASRTCHDFCDFTRTDVVVSNDGQAIFIANEETTKENQENAGAVHVYRRIGFEWKLQMTLGPNGGNDFASTNDFFGTMMYISDDTNRLAVYSPRDDDMGDNYGAVYVFEQLHPPSSLKFNGVTYDDDVHSQLSFLEYMTKTMEEALSTKTHCFAASNGSVIVWYSFLDGDFDEPQDSVVQQAVENQLQSSGDPFNLTSADLAASSSPTKSPTIRAIIPVPAPPTFGPTIAPTSSPKGPNAIGLAIGVILLLIIIVLLILCLVKRDKLLYVRRQNDLNPIEIEQTTFRSPTSFRNNNSDNNLPQPNDLDTDQVTSNFTNSPSAARANSSENHFVNLT